MTNFDTIAAISTPFGKGGVAVIRLSGADALAITQKIFRPKSSRYPSLSHAPARSMVYGEIVSPDNREVLDDVLCVYFPAPHSFTGEDVVEISCHGGVLV
ncbi:MAG: tRNA uridine-5-carboxymethylaminomethyl(34) synthesis GTPase MnmE, partial [Ruminococcaceae bacterium]|nr:tRNA uridine-5-carboxymethylaminomethyl(34) synthesis GTPase MnmE [Oscillospiraceae bacterium]